MTKDELAKAAIDADLWPALLAYSDFLDSLERFAALVADAEREACAKACDKGIGQFQPDGMWNQGYDSASRAHAAAIRARGDHV